MKPTIKAELFVDVVKIEFYLLDLFFLYFDSSLDDLFKLIDKNMNWISMKF